MHMDLNNVIIFNDNKRIANTVQDGTHPAHVARFVTAFGDKFSAVSKGDILILDRTEIGCGPCGFCGGCGVVTVDAAERVKHP